MNFLKTIAQLVAPLAFLRLYGGGGGDGGAGQMRQDEQDRQKKVQQAVDAINGKFGIGPAPASTAAALGPAPTPEQFMRQERTGHYEGDDWRDGTTPVLDEAAYNAALANYNARGAAESANVGQVSQAKAAREAMYADISGAVKDTAMRDLDQQYSTASNRNLFGLARSGLLGGSVDAESGGNLKRLYGEGQLKAEQAGLGAAADLRTQDEKTRQNLISLAQSGLDTGTADSMAAGQMAAAADSAKANAAGFSVGRLFDDLSQGYVNRQYLNARYPQGVGQQQPSGYGTPSLYGTNRYTGTAGR